MRSAELDAYLASIPRGNGFEAFFEEYGVNYRWMALGAVVLGNLVALLAVTMINVAVPAVMGAFGVGQDQAQWLATGNLAASTMAMLVCRWFTDRYGLRNLMLLAMALFFVGSLLGGIATNFEVMIIARIMQGITAGLLAPMAMTMIFQLFPPGKQGLAMGLSALGIILAPALGPTLGGVLVDEFNWRYVFLLGVPVSLIGIPAAISFLPERVEGKARPFDYLGFTLLTVSVTSMLVAITNGQRFGWESNYVTSMTAIAIVFAIWFVYSQSRVTYPLMNISLFRIPQFLTMSIFAFALSAGLYGSTYLIPLVIQLVQHQTPTQAGLLMMPAGLAMAISFPLIGKLSDSVSHIKLITIGTLGFAWSFWLMGGIDERTSFWTLAIWVLISRVSMSLVNTPTQISALADVPPQQLADASGAFSFMRQVGGAFGVNVMAQVLEYRRTYHSDYLLSTQTWDNSYSVEIIQMLRGLSHRFGVEGNDQWAFAYQGLGGMIQQQALIAAFKDSFMIVAVAFALLLLMVLRISKPNNKTK